MAHAFHVTIEGTEQGRLEGGDVLKSVLFEFGRPDAAGREIIQIESKLGLTMAADSWSGQA